MSDNEVIKYVIRDPLECNLSYMPFINDGGLFIPTMNTYSLGDNVLVDLTLPGKTEALRIEGKVVWMTPKNALHHVLPGIGVQFTGANSKVVRAQIEAHLDSKIEVGGYTYGITEETRKEK
jgi:type IV pilus assembly protein PilZ